MNLKFEKTRWGMYIVMQDMIRGEKQAKVKNLHIYPYQSISYQTHAHRGENWTVVAGSGTFVQDGKFYDISQGMSVSIPIGSKHAVKASGEGLEIIEVQFGNECSETDINRIYMEWDSIVRFAEEDELNG